MFSFGATIRKFNSKGEKTGWTYVDIPPDILAKLKLSSKKEFRVKGFIDDVSVSRLAAYPVGGGDYIIALNAEIRKKLGKKEGAMVKLKIAPDTRESVKSEDLIACLEEDQGAKTFFESLNASHRNYFHRHVLSAKTAATKTSRIVNIINAMHKKQNFGEMVRSLKEKRKGLT